MRLSRSTNEVHMIGLAGTHRVGKTTLAKAWAEQNDIDYITPDVKGVIATFGKTCDMIGGIDERIEIQRRIVQSCNNTFLRRKKIFITDRTPIDVAAYTLADAGQELTDKQANDLNEIVMDCIELTNSSFFSLCLVQPGIPYVTEKGSPLPNIAYQEHIHTLIQGLMRDERVNVMTWSIPRSNTDHDNRLEAVDEVHAEIIENAGYEAEGAVMN